MLAFVVFLPFVLGALAPWLGRFRFLILAAASVGSGIWLAASYLRGGPRMLLEHYTWWEGLGAALSFRADGLSMLLGLLILGIGAGIFLYAHGYLHGRDDEDRIAGYLSIFQGAMLGLVMSDNLIALFVFWELTSITSYLLVGTQHADARARANALQALVVTGAGGLVMFAGFLALGQVAGTYELREILTMGSELQADPLYPLITFLIVIGAFTKSAQFPFHFWLPNAMVAPTPISAYLHSATMVKAGVYLLARLHPALGDTALWTILLVGAGTITFLLAAIAGLRHVDLKAILAHTTLAVLGLLTLLIGVGSELAIKSAVLFLFGHALYKAALFMVAGTLDHEAHTRDVRLLRGLRGVMPFTAAAAGLAALSKAGFPPFFGFLGKEYVYKAGWTGEPWSGLFLTIAVVGNAVLFALACKVGVHPFWTRKEEDSADVHHEAPWSFWLPALTLSVTGLVFGLFPAILAGPLTDPAAMAILGEKAGVTLKLWHGFTGPLLLSVVTLVGGLTIYRLREKIWRRGGLAPESVSSGIFERLLQGTLELADILTRLVQSGKMRRYVLTVFAATGLLILYQLFRYPGWVTELPPDTGVWWLPFLVVLMIAGAIFASITNSRLAALISLGVVGFGLALIFAVYSAPDVAITQLLVETLTVLLFVLVIFRLPQLRSLTDHKARLRDASISTCLGLILGAVSLKTAHLQFGPAISSQLAQWSYLEAKGRNIVNVILVDFRALDTLGEITVLAIAALGVVALSSSVRETMSAGSHLRSPLLASAGKVFVPLLLVLSLIVLYRGHNLPGGGFIGGLIAASAALYAMLYDSPATAVGSRLRNRAGQLSAVGLLTAVVSGFFALGVGDPFLTGLWLPTFSLPLLGTIHLGTPLLFDVGVFLTVTGFTLSTVFALSETYGEEVAPWKP